MINTNITKYDYKTVKEWLQLRVHKIILPSNVDFIYLVNLIDRHPSKQEWKNQTSQSFKVSKSPGNGNIVLYVRFDGSQKYRIVSWVACAKGKLSKHQETGNVESQLNGAMRYAIRIQIGNYRKGNPDQTCQLCGTKDRIEVDHYPKHFVELKNDFIKVQREKGLVAPESFKWHPKKGNFMFKDGTKATNYYDKKWKQSWQRYHNNHATYRYLCSNCNKRTNQHK
jgi:hypothetical protein